MIPTLTVRDTGVKASLNALVQKQMPFALALAMTNTVKLIRDATINEMKVVFDRPTRYTLNSLFIVPARKGTLIAKVGFKSESHVRGIPPTKFIGPQVFGGPRSLKRSEVALRRRGILPADRYLVPGTAIRLDSSGNISAGTMTQILSVLKALTDPYAHVSARSRLRNRKPREYFVGRPGGRPLGVWERYANGTRVRPILMFVRQPQYAKRLDFFGIANRLTEQQFNVQFEKALRFALETAR